MSAEQTRPVKVLIVDDDEDIREIALMCLERDSRLEVQAVGSGREALGLAIKWQPDLMLLDVVMPDLDGPATVGRLRLHPLTRSIPVVFLTARSDGQDIAEFMALGIAGVITKPFDPIALPDLVHNHIKALD
jgi:CheY-like chemotaxis protein